MGSMFNIFERLIYLNSSGAIVVMVYILLETLITISTFIIFIETTYDAKVNKMYDYIHYVDVTLPVIVAGHFAVAANKFNHRNNLLYRVWSHFVPVPCDFDCAALGA